MKSHEINAFFYDFSAFRRIDVEANISEDFASSLNFAVMLLEAANYRNRSRHSSDSHNPCGAHIIHRLERLWNN